MTDIVKFLSYSELRRRALGFQPGRFSVSGGANMVFKLVLIGIVVLMLAGVGYFLVWVSDLDKFEEGGEDGKE